jgi:hypothetical protein
MRRSRPRTPWAPSAAATDGDLLADPPLFRLTAITVNSRRRYSGVHEALKARPILSMPQICRATGLSFPAAASAMGLLVDLGIARELTGRRRNRLFAYSQYLATLSEGTEAF